MSLLLLLYAAHAAIEPFATLFGLKGTTVQWYLISLVIGGAFFIPRFWCRFFCPAGVCFTKASGIRRSFKRGIHIQPRMKRLCMKKLRIKGIAILVAGVLVHGFLLASLLANI